MFEFDTSCAPADVESRTVIRRVVISDLPKLEWFGQFRRYRNIFQQTFEEHLSGRRLMLVADLDSFPIGQIVVQFSSARTQFADGRTRGYLYALRVLQPFRHRGVGTRLIRWAEQALIERQYLWSTIAVAKDNHGARRLYERLDYRVFADDPGRWRYTDPDGEVHFVVEPSWVLAKRLATGDSDCEEEHGWAASISTVG